MLLELSICILITGLWFMTKGYKAFSSAVRYNKEALLYKKEALTYKKEANEEYEKAIATWRHINHIKIEVLKNNGTYVEYDS